MSSWFRKPSFWIPPVFVLIVAVFVLIESNVRRVEPLSVEPRRNQAKSSRRVFANERRVERSTTARPPRSESIVRRADGTVRQAFATKPGLVCLTDPLGGIPVMESPSVDEILYIRDEYHDRTNGRDWMLIGGFGGEPIGWARPADLIEWPSRYAFQPSREATPADTEGVILAADRACLIALRTGRACAKHGSRCPNETIAGEFLTAGKGGAAAPIVEVDSIEIESTQREYAYRIAVYPYTKPPPPRREGDRVREVLMNVYLVFIATPSLWSARERDATLGLIDSFERELNERAGGFRFHLAFEAIGGPRRENDERPIGIVDFIDPKAFRDRATRLIKVADSFGGTYADAIEAALPPLNPSKDRKAHLSWPDERSSRPLCKLIVTIGPGRGDDFEHERILRDIFISKHREIGFVSIPFANSRTTGGRGGVDLDLDSRRTLAEQGHRNPRALAEGLRRIPPRFEPVATPRELSARFWKILEEELAWTNDLIDLVRAEDSGKIKEYVNKRGLSPIMVSGLLTRCRVAAGPAPVSKRSRSNAARIPAWKTGWIDRSTVLKRRLGVVIPLSVAEIDRLIDRLKTLVDSTDDESSIAVELERIEAAIVDGGILFLRDKAEQPEATEPRPGGRAAANARPRKSLQEAIETLLGGEKGTLSPKDSIRRTLEAIESVRRSRESEAPSSTLKINEMSIIDLKNLRF